MIVKADKPRKHKTSRVARHITTRESILAALPEEDMLFTKRQKRDKEAEKAEQILKEQQQRIKDLFAQQSRNAIILKFDILLLSYVFNQDDEKISMFEKSALTKYFNTYKAKIDKNIYKEIKYSDYTDTIGDLIRFVNEYNILPDDIEKILHNVMTITKYKSKYHKAFHEINNRLLDGKCKDSFFSFSPQFITPTYTETQTVVVPNTDIETPNDTKDIKREMLEVILLKYIFSETSNKLTKQEKNTINFRQKYLIGNISKDDAAYLTELLSKTMHMLDIKVFISKKELSNNLITTVLSAFKETYNNKKDYTNIITRLEKNLLDNIKY